METLTTLLVFVTGFVAGTLVTRNNIKRVNSIVEEAKEFAAKVDEKIDKLTESQKKPVAKTVAKGRKPVKKTAAAKKAS